MFAPVSGPAPLARSVAPRSPRRSQLRRLGAVDGGDFSGFCQVEWSGGTAPYTVTWSLPGSDFFGTVGGFDSATRTATISGSCVAGGELEAIATITDADGHTIQGGGGAECDS